jgi:hypothetical protein
MLTKFGDFNNINIVGYVYYLHAYNSCLLRNVYAEFQNMKMVVVNIKCGDFFIDTCFILASLDVFRLIATKEIYCCVPPRAGIFGIRTHPLLYNY